jgi:hypothetical protein
MEMRRGPPKRATWTPDPEFKNIRWRRAQENRVSVTFLGQKAAEALRAQRANQRSKER